MNDKSLSVIKVKVVVVGDVGVGKTSLTYRYTHKEFLYYYQWLVGANMRSRTLGFKDKSVVFNIWESSGQETSGQEMFQSLVQLYCRDAGIALTLYDISSHKSFENVESWLLKLQQYGPRDLKYALIGNKVDLDGNVRHVREVQTHEGQLLAESHGLYFAETSARSGEGIEKVFYDMGCALVESCKKEKGSSTVSLCDSFVQRMKKTCC